MISILSQERLLGAALGATFVSAAVVWNRSAIRSTIPKNQSDDASQPKAHVVRKKICSEVAPMWNKTVDQTLGRVVTYLSSRGW